MAQVPTRTEAERKADRDELLSDLKAAREELEREERRRARIKGATPGTGGHQATKGDA